jgi:protein phosphatase
MLDDESIGQVLQAHDSLDEAGAALIDAANDAGGKDNIAVVLVRVRGQSIAPRSWWPFRR